MSLARIVSLGTLNGFGFDTPLLIKEGFDLCVQGHVIGLELVRADGMVKASGWVYSKRSVTAFYRASVSIHGDGKKEFSCSCVVRYPAAFHRAVALPSDFS